ncbi:hypothetical protein ACW9H6_27485, partial [Pseudomonas sp. SDO528_S397]
KASMARLSKHSGLLQTIPKIVQRARSRTWIMPGWACKKNNNTNRYFLPNQHNTTSLGRGNAF